MPPQKTKANLPNPGDVFLMPLEDGRFGVCRILQKGRQGRQDRVLVIASPWIDSGEPDLSLPLLREVLTLNHHAWQNSPAMLWLWQPLPAEFKQIGFLEPTEAEKQIWCGSGASWEWLATQLLEQWRWDHDRETVIKEDESKAQEQKTRREDVSRLRSEYLATVTLKDLRVKQRFEIWKESVPAAALHDTRQIFLDTIDNLIALGPEASETTRLDLLKGCIESLNLLDSQNDHFIETYEREDLCDAFEEIVHACKMGHHKNLADKWREW